MSTLYLSPETTLPQCEKTPFDNVKSRKEGWYVRYAEIVFDLQ